MPPHGVFTVDLAVVQVAQEALAETQASVQPLVLYLDTLRQPVEDEAEDSYWY